MKLSGKLWRRRRHQEIARELEEISSGPHQQAWIASYRVFSPYNNPDRSSSGLSPTSFPIHPTPCMGKKTINCLFVCLLMIIN